MQSQNRYSSKNFSAQSHSVEPPTDTVPFLRDSVRGHIYDLSYPENEGHAVNINSQNKSQALATLKSLKDSKWVHPANGTNLSALHSTFTTAMLTYLLLLS